MRIKLSELRKIIHEEIVDEAIGRDGSMPGKFGDAMAPDPGPMKKFLASKFAGSIEAAKGLLKDPSKVQALVKSVKGEYSQFDELTIKKAIADVIMSMK